MPKGYCPECDSDINFHEEPQLDERFYCPTCNAYLVVIGLHPIEVDWVYIDDQIKLGDAEYET